VHFQHASDIWASFPELVPGVLVVDGLTRDGAVGRRVAELTAVAEGRLASASEGALPEVQAWRRAFSRMGLKPTQYRCASESLLRRLRKEGSLPTIHPVIDLCNAASAAFAIPVAAFDVSEIAEHLEVRLAAGDETYLSFSGETEHPVVDEVIFADAAGRAHARRWTNRQSARSAVRETTRAVLVVAEAMHDSARSDVERLTARIEDDLSGVGSVAVKPVILSRSAPRVEF
jgi:DNA/RNA-binding domain of Phe-tRNA-synthetase-like protein